MTDFILDQPDQIRAFALLQVYHKLKMEVDHPNGPKWQGSPAKQARQILLNAGIVLGQHSRKKTVLAEYTAYLEAIGLK
jgi:hypothetical protein